jgi:hypothetical protein
MIKYDTRPEQNLLPVSSCLCYNVGAYVTQLSLNLTLLKLHLIKSLDIEMSVNLAFNLLTIFFM